MRTNPTIVISKETRFGKPVIKGTRIAVTDVLNWLSFGMTIEEIIYDFPELTTDQINACVEYAANNKEKFVKPHETSI